MARIAIHPGEHLAEQLEELGLSAAELGRQLGVPTNRITAIINGQRAVTGDSALRLGHYFGVSPEFWLNLQANYDLRVAEAKIGKQLKSMPRLASSGRRNIRVA
jgi:addiction module HigA family antidote